MIARMVETKDGRLTQDNGVLRHCGLRGDDGVGEDGRRKMVDGRW
jgi:hypothetical protein